jgi:hypothetical protein
MRRSCLAGAAAVTALALAGPALPKTYPTLYGEVTKANTISLKTKAGAPVKTLKAGTYVFSILDLSKICDFHFVGPGVDQKTPVQGTVTASWLMRLGPGKYSYFCDRFKKQFTHAVTVK